MRMRILPEQTFSNIPIERVQSYWDQRPCNIRHSSKIVGTEDYFNEVEARKYLVEPHILAFAEFSRWKNKRVLEIGCGIGTDTINFARNGAQVTAIDISENSLDIARQRAKVFGLEHKITFYQANIEELSQVLPIEKYDLVYSFGVLHHTPQPNRAISQLRNYLHSGSILKIMMYHRYSWKVLQILLEYGNGKFWRVDELVAQHSEAQTGCPVTYIYSRQQLSQLLCGFKDIQFQVEHIFPYLIPDYIQYRYVKAKYFRCLPKALFQWLEHRIGWHLCVTAKI